MSRCRPGMVSRPLWSSLGRYIEFGRKGVGRYRGEVAPHRFVVDLGGKYRPSPIITAPTVRSVLPEHRSSPKSCSLLPLDGVGLVDGSTLPSGDRGFESISLQRRVGCEPDFLGNR
jgi:hypothetical protein